MTEKILIGIFVAVNTLSLLIMARDKQKSARRSNAERTPEGHIFFLASAFGGIGVYVGMQIFHHKTKKWYFQLGIPLLIIQNLVTLYLAYETLIQY